MNPSHIRAQRNAAPPLEAHPTATQLWSGLALGGVAGIVAALFPLLDNGKWYHSLFRPIWAPVEWAFAPLQVFIFLLAGAGLSYLWASRSTDASKRVVLTWFWIQLVLGVAWSFCFFVLHSSAWGYVVVMLLWCAVVALLWTGSRLSRRGFWFLAPLFFWATFASSLTFAILSFNVLRDETARMDADPANANAAIDPAIIVRKK